MQWLLRPGSGGGDRLERSRNRYRMARITSCCVSPRCARHVVARVHAATGLRIRAGTSMKALVLSGGRGTRLRPITHTSAKQLVPIANKPILFYALEGIVAAGLTDIGMIVGDTEEEIRSAVGDGSRWGARVTYIRQSAPLGLAHAVKIAEPFLKRENFVMYLGDNLVRDGVTSFVQRFAQRQPDGMILLAHVTNPELFGVVELSDGRVT